MGIPEAVYGELTTNPRFPEEANQIRECEFIRVVGVSDRRVVSVLQRVAGLDLGESEAIAYADDNRADVLLMDEVAGRRVALDMGMRIMGSVGVLVTAFKEGHIDADDAERAFLRIRNANRHIGERLIADALAIIHEANDR